MPGNSRFSDKGAHHHHRLRADIGIVGHDRLRDAESFDGSAIQPNMGPSQFPEVPTMEDESRCGRRKRCCPLAGLS
jgi:hypothetical protein